MGLVLNTLRCGVQVLLGHVEKSDGNRGTLEVSDGDKCLEQWYVHDLDKRQTMPTEYSLKKVHGAGDLIPRRFVIEVDITAATSLLKHAASLGFQHLVKFLSINILKLLGIRPRGVHAVRVVGVAQIVNQARVERRSSRSCAGLGCHGGPFQLLVIHSSA